MSSSPSPEPQPENLMAQRFRGFLPVAVDVETGGFNSRTDALLEVAAVTMVFDRDGRLLPDQALNVHVEPFEGSNIEPAALEFTGIDPYHPLRGALPERDALREIFTMVRRAVRAAGCNRAVLVGHNAHFDNGFIQAAAARQQLKRNPFHPFSSFDTATLAGVAFGQTVLAKACEAAELAFDSREAHSALYDAQKTAELFCVIVNRFRDAGFTPK